MIYKDLKPENILMGADGYICLTDFGLARLQPDKMDSNIFYGTPEYFGIFSLRWDYSPSFTKFSQRQKSSLESVILNKWTGGVSEF